MQRLPFAHYRRSPLDRAAYAVVSSLALFCVVSCSNSRPSKEDLAVAMEHAFDDVTHHDSIVLLGALHVSSEEPQRASTVWALTSPQPFNPRGKIVTQLKTSSDALRGIIAGIDLRDVTVPEITADQCEFAEWKNEYGVWRMRSTEAKEGFVITLEENHMSQE